MASGREHGGGGGISKSKKRLRDITNNVVGSFGRSGKGNQRRRQHMEDYSWDWDVSAAPLPAIIRASGNQVYESEDTREMTSDIAWYDREEGIVAFGADCSFFNDPSFQKKQANLSKRLVRKDGTLMSFAQSKKLSQRSAHNAQWEDQQLLRSGAARNKVALEFDDEDEEPSSAVLLVQDKRPPFLDGRVVFTKQADPIMPVKDPTSDMAIIARKGSSLVGEVREKQSMFKSRQRFWELAGSKLGDILGVEKSAEQIDADTARVGEEGEVDFKEGGKFG